MPMEPNELSMGVGRNALCPLGIPRIFNCELGCSISTDTPIRAGFRQLGSQYFVSCRLLGKWDSSTREPHLSTPRTRRGRQLLPHEPHRPLASLLSTNHCLILLPTSSHDDRSRNPVRVP